MTWLNLVQPWDHGGTNIGGLISLKVLTTTASALATRIYEGSVVCIGADGYAALLPADEAGAQFAGIAAEDLEWTAGEGNVYIKVWTKGQFWMWHDADTVAQTDVGAQFQTVTAGTTYGPIEVEDHNPDDVEAVTVGMCCDIDANNTSILKISISGYAMGPAGLATYAAD